MTDPPADQKRFDPRFDPAFQPGYDADSDPSIAARSTPRRFDAAPPPQSPPPERIAPPEYPVRARAFAPSSAAPASFAPAHLATTSAPAQPAAVTSADASPIDELFPESGTAADDPALSRGVNPFAVTLWVISVVLVAAGIAMFRSLPGIEQQGLFSTEDPSTTSFGQVFALAALSAILGGSGVLVAVGNLFMLAARWSKRSG